MVGNPGNNNSDWFLFRRRLLNKNKNATPSFRNLIEYDIVHVVYVFKFYFQLFPHTPQPPPKFLTTTITRVYFFYHYFHGSRKALNWNVSENNDNWTSILFNGIKRDFVFKTGQNEACTDAQCDAWCKQLTFLYKAPNARKC